MLNIFQYHSTAYISICLMMEMIIVALSIHATSRVSHYREQGKSARGKCCSAGSFFTAEFFLPSEKKNTSFIPIAAKRSYSR